MPVKLGEMLLKAHMVSPQQLQDALNHQKQNGGKLGKAFVVLGFVRDEEITSLLSRQYGIPSINLERFNVDPAIIKIIPAETARKYQVLPLSRSGATLTIAMADPTNVFAMDDIKFMTGYNVEPVVASESVVEEAIEKYYGSMRSYELRRDAASTGGGQGAPIGSGARAQAIVNGPTLSADDMAALGGLSEIDLDSMSDADADADADVKTVKPDDDEIDLGNLARSAAASPAVKLTNVLFVDCLKRGASAIHIEPYEKELRVRFRIDGVLYNVMRLPMAMRDSLTSRLKVMARLNIAERRLPQEGFIRITLRVEDRSRALDFRVSVRPTLWGETVVLRLLNKSQQLLDMGKLGFEPHSLDRFRTALARRSGMVLVTGPRRSGKTTTLCASLAALNGPDTHVVTVEDAVELDLPGINQIAVNKATGEGAAAVLRSLYHVDSDVVLVSDIGDADTARAAFSLAERGHLVLSTLPATDAPSTVVRLAHMGLAPYLLATLNLVEAQRLVRRICTKCKWDATAEVPPEALIDLGFRPEEIGTFKVLQGRGCHACNGTGYRGQVGLFEVMEVTEGFRYLFMAGATAAEIKRTALVEGMLTLRMSGLEKIKNGVTTVEEVLRETVL